MQIHRSNRVEALLTQLSQRVAEPQADPLASECIVVQGRGMERWLSFELADRLGVFALPDFPFPRAFLQRSLARVLGDDPAGPGDPTIDEAFEPSVLTWSIAESFSGFEGDPRFEPVIRYLDGDTRGEKALELARRIAETLDHYVVYRPDWVLAWEAGATAPGAGLDPGDEAWQAELWRTLVDQHGSCHLAARIRAFVDSLAAAAPPPGALPARVSVFGISTLPPLFLGALAAMGRVTDVHLFVMSPSREYWGQIRSQREQLRERRAAGGAGPAEAEAWHLEEGHSLLASLGRVGRDFQEILEVSADYQESDEDLYLDPIARDEAAPSMLEVLQSDILNLIDRGAPRGGAEPLVCAPGDRSIQVHACHGPMREAEVLRDQLLDLFEKDPSLEPRDVIVMTPDVDAYAPFIEATFGAEGGEGGHRAIPCRVADRGTRSVYEVAEAFFRLLDVLSGRLPASAVLDLLGLPAIRDRFGITEADEPTLRDWVLGAGVRWGKDAEHRGREDQPPVDDNTWRFGLDRLFVGYAMADRDDALFAGVRPFDAAEGTHAELLGRLSDFATVLFGFHGRVEKARGLREWEELLAEILDRMITTDSETQHQLQLIREALGALVRAGERASYSGKLTLASVREQLDVFLARKPPGGGFLAGGVTFCELVPMRTVPFRVVCLMGLNDAGFPRIRRQLGFDMIARSRRHGDRSSREDDRYLFLEALLSARDHFLVTYRGQSERDNESLPPSVVVGELLDHLDRAFALPGDAVGDVREAVVVKHPLQPFSPRYFDAASPDPRLFSYSQTGFAGAEALAGEPSAPGCFFPEPLAAPAEEPVRVELDDLVAFYRNPARFLFRNRLRVFLAADGDVRPDREPMELADLDRWQVGDELIDRLVQGRPPGPARDRIRGLGILPLGQVGECAYAAVEAEAARLAECARGLQAGAPRPLLDLDLPLESGRVVGSLGHLWDSGRVRARFSKLGGPWEIDEWIRHLALCAAAPPGCEPITHVVGRAATRHVICIRFEPVEDPGAMLGRLVGVFARGQRAAMPFFPRSSRAYVQTLRKGEGDDRESQATNEAYAAWNTDRDSGGKPTAWRIAEGEEVNFQRAFADQHPLAPTWRPVPGEDADGFRSLAQTVFGALFDHRTECR